MPPYWAMRVLLLCQVSWYQTSALSPSVPLLLVQFPTSLLLTEGQNQFFRLPKTYWIRTPLEDNSGKGSLHLHSHPLRSEPNMSPDPSLQKVFPFLDTSRTYPPDPNPSSQTWFGPDFWPDFDPIRTRNPPFQVRIGSGQNRVRIRSGWRGSEGVGSRGVGAARKAL